MKCKHCKKWFSLDYVSKNSISVSCPYCNLFNEINEFEEERFFKDCEELENRFWESVKEHEKQGKIFGKDFC